MTVSREQMTERLLKAARQDPALRTEWRRWRQGLSASEASPGDIDFSVIFFNAMNSGQATSQYEKVLSLSRFADRNGFRAVWLPERHFHPFGGIFSNPATVCAAIAVQTDRIRVRSGSVVLPLHHPVEVVEAWAIVDNLSNGRVDMCFASGWNPNDFVISPDTFQNLREVWFERLPMVQALWRGDKLEAINGLGEPASLEVYPKPVQPELNVWLAATKRDETFVEAGRRGYNVLTMLQGIDLDELGRKIGLYREARRESGRDPETGTITLTMHTFVHPDEAYIAEQVREPFYAYIKSGLSGHLQRLRKEEQLDEAEIARVVEYSYERYFRTGALFGSVDKCLEVVDKARSVGVNELACLVAFGMPDDVLESGLSHLVALRQAAAQRSVGKPVEAQRSVGKPVEAQRSVGKPVEAQRSVGKPVGAATVNVEEPEDIRRVVARSLEDVLELESGEAQMTTPFQEYGLDSVMAMRVVMKIEKRSGVKVPAKWLITYPTVESLATKLAPLVERHNNSRDDS